MGTPAETRPSVTLQLLLGDIRPASVDLREYPVSAQPMLEHGQWRLIDYMKGRVLAEQLPKEHAFAIAHTLNRLFWEHHGVYLQE